MEGMLIQAQQAQKKHRKLSTELSELKLTTTESNKDDEPAENLIKEEIMEVDTETGSERSKNMPKTDQEMSVQIIEDTRNREHKNGDAGESDNGQGVGDYEDDEEEISIDPRTYCKLGHFHLLLEDYAKGELM